MEQESANSRVIPDLEDVQSEQEVREIAARAIADEYGDDADTVEVGPGPGGRMRVVMGIGTGVSRVMLTGVLNLTSREMLEIDDAMLDAYQFNPQMSWSWDGWEVFLMDSTGENFEDILRAAIPENHEMRDEIIDAILDDRTGTFSAKQNGFGRQTFRGLYSQAGNIEDLAEMFSIWNQPVNKDILYPNFPRGGTSSATTHTVDIGLRNGNLVPAQSGQTIMFWTQMGTMTNREPFESVGGGMTSDVEQEVEGLAIAEDLVNDGLITNNILLQTDMMALVRAAMLNNKGQSWIDEMRGEQDAINLEVIKQNAKTNRLLRHHREPARLNDLARLVHQWIEMLYSQPKYLDFHWRDEDMDPADVRDNYLAGKNLIPAVNQVNGVNALQDQHPALSTPTNYEQSVAALSRTMPGMAMAPMDSDHVTGVYTFLAVGGEQNPEPADLDVVRHHLADELGVSGDDITAGCIQGMGKNRLAHGPIWLSNMTLFEVENQTPVYDRLI